jgi:pimeloyl-ACP methyl ester carboxylesterase
MRFPVGLGSHSTFELPVYKWVELPNLFDIPGYRNLAIPIYRSPGRFGPGVLLVHGNSCSSRAYVHQVFSVLGRVLEMYLVDMAGFGRSQKIEPDLPLPTDELGVPVGFPEYQIGMMESVYAVASDPDLAPTVFVGWSLGGDILLLARGAGLLPNAEGFMIFGTAPAGADPPTTEAPFKGPDVPGAPLSILLSFALAFELDVTAPLGFTFNGDFADLVPAYAPPPISDAPNIGEAFARALFDEEQRSSGDVPAFFLEDTFDRADARARGSIGVAALGLLPPGTLPDELEVLEELAGDPASPDDDIPIAVLVGEEEALVNRQYLRDLASEGAIPTLWLGNVLEIPGAGHAVQFDSPALFNALLGLFVADVAYD